MCESVTFLTLLEPRLFVNRHELETLGAIGITALFAIGTSLVLVGTFFAPTATRDLIGDVGILLAALGFSAWTIATVLYGDRIVGWVRHRAALADSP